MIYSKESSHSPEELEQRIRDAAQKRKFGVLHIHNLTETLRSKGVELGADCRVLDVCNPQAASQALHGDMSVSAVLPCRISVFSDSGGSRIATVNPTDLLAATGVKGVDQLAKEIETQIQAIIDEAAG